MREDELRNLPKNWEIRKINEIGDLFSGNSINAKIKEEKYLNISNGVPYIATKDVGFDRSIDYENGVRIPEPVLNNFRVATKNTILICAEGGSAGRKIGITNQDVCFVNKLFALSVNTDIQPHYVFYYYQSERFQTEFKSNLTGLIGGVSKSKFKKIPIPIPPLPEQKQIVKILDQAFDAIDKAKANIERNIVNANELFQSKLNEIFSQKGEGWEEKTLGDITTKIGSGSTPRGGQASYKESGISLIRSMNVHDDGFREKKLAFIDEKQAAKLNNVTIEENDVLLNITGASVARCCIVDVDYLPARVNQHVSIIRLKEGIMNHRFLHYALTSSETKNLLLGIGAQGATRQAITKVQIENFKIKFPSDIKLQNKIVDSLDLIRGEALSIALKYEQKLQNLEELKKSILQKAFSGELTN